MDTLEIAPEDDDLLQGRELIPGIDYTPGIDLTINSQKLLTEKEGYEAFLYTLLRYWEMSSCTDLTDILSGGGVCSAWSAHGHRFLVLLARCLNQR